MRDVVVVVVVVVVIDVDDLLSCTTTSLTSSFLAFLSPMVGNGMMCRNDVLLVLSSIFRFVAILCFHIFYIVT